MTLATGRPVNRAVMSLCAPAHTSPGAAASVCHDAQIFCFVPSGCRTMWTAPAAVKTATSKRPSPVKSPNATSRKAVGKLRRLRLAGRTVACSSERNDNLRSRPASNSKSRPAATNTSGMASPSNAPNAKPTAGAVVAKTSAVARPAPFGPSKTNTPPAPSFVAKPITTSGKPSGRFTSPTANAVSMPGKLLSPAVANPPRPSPASHTNLLPPPAPKTKSAWLSALKSPAPRKSTACCAPQILAWAANGAGAVSAGPVLPSCPKCRVNSPASSSTR